MKSVMHKPAQSVATLWRLAKAVGVKPAYTDTNGRHVRTTPEALLHVLQCYGVEIASVDDATDAMQRWRAGRERQVLEPVYVVWRHEGHETRHEGTKARRHEGARSKVAFTLVSEDGTERRITENIACEGLRAFVTSCLRAFRLPIGYHRLQVEFAGRQHTSHVFVAPPRAYRPDDAVAPRWGAFLPLYALQSDRSWGAGDLTDLHALSRWIHQQQGSVVGTLPLLASYLDEPFNPSPYAPVSRQFFNEFYLDVTAPPELARCEKARQLLSSPEFESQRHELQTTTMVEYRRAILLKRRVLEPLAETFFNTPSDRRDALLRELEHNEELSTYAAFRAATERHSATWRQWPKRLQEGRLTPDDYDENAWQYHLYVQFLLREQLEHVSQGGARLYLDLPVGVNPDGYDVWRHRDDFVDDVNIGAPPDALFSGGQDWGLLPMHPLRSQQRGHDDFRAAIRAHLRYAGALRIDHIMSLHRLYWVPHGMSPRDGVYVRYPAEELYAILCIESHRHQAEIVGENLGTVPDVVNRIMNSHGIAPLYVAQFAWTGKRSCPIDPPPPGAVASINTHDVPMFAAFWNGDDIQQRIEMNLLTPDQAEEESQAREEFRLSIREAAGKHSADEQIFAALLALLRRLASSDAGLVLLNLEDLWLERRPQNVPGTSNDKNWRRKARYSLEQICSSPQVLAAVREVNNVPGRTHA